MKMNPIILKGTYKLEKTNSENLKTTQIVSTTEMLFNSQLESWICKQICGKRQESAAFVEAIRRLQKPNILNIRDYMLTILSGRTVNIQELRECFVEALVELNLDLKDLRNIDREKLEKINKSSFYKGK